MIATKRTIQRRLERKQYGNNLNLVRLAAIKGADAKPRRLRLPKYQHPATKTHKQRRMQKLIDRGVVEEQKR